MKQKELLGRKITSWFHLYSYYHTTKLMRSPNKKVTPHN
jgi:hypothetical protein